LFALKEIQKLSVNHNDDVMLIGIVAIANEAINEIEQ
jgi:hypothetical protein